MNHRLLLITLILIAVVGCNLKTEKSGHLNTLIALNADYNNYGISLKATSNEIYKQIGKIELTDSSLLLIKEKMLEIKKHADKLVEGFDRYQSEIEKENKLSEISGITKQEAFRMKEDMVEFQMHIVYINSKTTVSKKLDERINTAINCYDYIPNETWEQTLILNKTKQNLLTIIQKLKFEVRLAEKIAIQFWHDAIRDEITTANKS